MTRRTTTLIQKLQDLFTEDEYGTILTEVTPTTETVWSAKDTHIQRAFALIVGQTASPNYDLAKHVASVLQPLTGESPSLETDSRHFAHIKEDLVEL